MSIKLGLPSKCRLMENTFDSLQARGITLTPTGSDREYAAAEEGIDGVTLNLISAVDIPRELAAGRIHFGVTGTDLVQERLPLWEQQLEPIAELGFGFADLVMAVPKAWADVDTLDDLDAVAAAFRERHGMRLRIATKYHRLVREYLRQGGVADYALVDSQGATEGTVANETAEAIADITSSGETLRANHLKVLSDGPILRSQATLWRSRTASVSNDDRAAIATLTDKVMS